MRHSSYLAERRLRRLRVRAVYEGRASQLHMLRYGPRWMYTPEGYRQALGRAIVKMIVARERWTTFEF